MKDALSRKTEAQNKLITYLDEQIQFLDDGGTLAGWRKQLQQQAPATAATPVQEPEFDNGLFEFMTEEERALFDGA